MVIPGFFNKSLWRNTGDDSIYHYVMQRELNRGVILNYWFCNGDIHDDQFEASPS